MVRCALVPRKAQSATLTQHFRAVIADEALDEFVRGSPLLWLSFLLPRGCNIELLFAQFLVMNLYGTALHTGVDFAWMPHQGKVGGVPIINAPYHHHIHHRLGTRNKPLHQGFFLQIWDQLMRCTYTGPCLCAQCGRPARTREAYDKIVKPDYSVLLTWKFWGDWLLHGDNGDAKVEAMARAEDESDLAEFKAKAE